MRRIVLLLPLLLIALAACSPDATKPPVETAAVALVDLPEVIAYRSPT